MLSVLKFVDRVTQADRRTDGETNRQGM